ncbi:hypothetical protein OFC56_32705, partial [Escherichia coli]|nr:hypothetical protein [Escherichia coli]
ESGASAYLRTDKPAAGTVEVAKRIATRSQVAEFFGTEPRGAEYLELLKGDSVRADAALLQRVLALWTAGVAPALSHDECASIGVSRSVFT